MAFRTPITTLVATNRSIAVEAELMMNFVLDDIAAWGPEKVESILRKYFDQHNWVAVVFDEWKYLIKAPNREWLESILARGYLRLENVQFPVVAWDRSFGEGRPLQSVWVRIFGFPLHFNDWDEYDWIFNLFGAFVLEVDPGTNSSYDVRFVRVRFGVCDLALLPRKHSAPYINAAGFLSVYDLELEVESPTTEAINGWRARTDGRPYPNGTEFGQRPGPPGTGNPPGGDGGPQPGAAGGAAMGRGAQPNGGAAGRGGGRGRGLHLARPLQGQVRGRFGIRAAPTLSPFVPVPAPVSGLPPIVPVQGIPSPESVPVATDIAQPTSLTNTIPSSQTPMGPAHTPGTKPQLHVSVPTLQLTDKGKGLDLSNTVLVYDGTLEGDSDLEEYADKLTRAEVYRIVSGIERGGFSRAGTEVAKDGREDDLFQDSHTVFSDTETDPILPLGSQPSQPLTQASPPAVMPIAPPFPVQNTSPQPDVSVANPITPGHTPHAGALSSATTPLHHAKPLSSTPKRSQQRKYTRGRKKAESHKPVKRDHSWGVSAIRPRASGVGLRLRTLQQRLGSGSTPTKAILIPDDPPTDLTTPRIEELPNATAEPRRSLRVFTQGVPEPTLTKAVKRKTTTVSSSGMALVTSFPYTRLTLEQIESLFQVYQLNLGRTVEERRHIISLLQTMNRNDFEQAIKALLGSDSQQPIGDFLSTYNAQLDTSLSDIPSAP